MRDIDRRNQLVPLWLNYAKEGERTETKLLGFSGWLEANRPELLKSGYPDSYQHLKTDLRGYIEQTVGPPEMPAGRKSNSKSIRAGSLTPRTKKQRKRGERKRGRK